MTRSRTSIWAHLAVLGLVVILAAPAAAFAAIPPPSGNSAADQYTETYPGAGGNQTSVPPTGSNPSKTLGSDTAREFQQSGPDGSAAAAAASATAPTAESGHRGAGNPSASAPAGKGESGPLEVVRHGLGSGSGGIGLLLPLILAASVIAAATFGVARRRRTAAG